MDKEIATHPSILAWRIRWTEETGGLQFMGSQRVGHYWATNTHTQTHNNPICAHYTNKKSGIEKQSSVIKLIQLANAEPGFEKSILSDAKA